MYLGNRTVNTRETTEEALLRGINGRLRRVLRIP